VLLEGTLEQIDGDAFEQLDATVPLREDGYPDPDDARGALYWEHVRWLALVKGIDPRTGIYTFKRGDIEKDPTEILFIGSASAVNDPPGGAMFLESCVTSPDCGDTAPNIAALEGLERSYVLEIYPDRWGQWISGYAPIRNSAGEIVGALGIDFEADYVVEIQQAIIQNTALAFTITFLLLFVSVYAISRAITRPINRLTRIAARIGEGDYEQDLSGLTHNNFPDEINALARVFDIMISKVRTREEKLKQKVAELQITIDQSKRDQQVSEIVDSDFFNELQAKARDMRGRKRGAQDATQPERPQPEPEPSGD
jgi:HAMP domain-containing protein